MSTPNPTDHGEPDRPGADPAGAAPFDPSRFGLPDHPVPPEYAPPGYVFPTQPPAAPPPADPWAPPSGGPPTHAGPAYRQYPQYGGPPPPLHHAYGQPKPGNGKSIAALVLGIVSIVFFWTTILDLVFIVPAVIFGILAIGEARVRNTGGRGQAIAGLICAGAAVLLIVIALVVVLHAATKCGGLSNSSDPGFNQCLRDHL